jgi:ABC-2 type transport system permease protein
MNERFNALLLREWMQHKRGWLITLLAPPLIFLVLLAMPFAQVKGIPQGGSLGVAVFTPLISAVGLMGLALLVSGLQWPGLARRDVQDRSIEFWLSLPGSHSQSIGATLLTHGLLLPLAALAVGYGFGLLIGPGLLLRHGGWAALAAVPWGQMLQASLPLLAGAMVGLVLMMLWLSPFVLAVMAASAWLKRWGLPALGGAIFGGGALLGQVYDNPVVWTTLAAQLDGASRAFVNDQPSWDARFEGLLSAQPSTADFAAAVAQDVGQSLLALASPQFIGGLAVAGLCFWLLVLKRARSA